MTDVDYAVCDPKQVATSAGSPWARSIESTTQIPMIGKDAAFCSVVDEARAVASKQSHVLVQGEVGTGKLHVAQFIHSLYHRSHALCRALDLRNVSEAGTAAILFGNVAGAFVGAFEERVGLLQQCDGGTLIIENVELMSAVVQARLADTLVSGSVVPLGGTQRLRIDVRVIATTGHPLQPASGNTAFVCALYKVLASPCIVLPPLRERRCDIPLLAGHFLESCCREVGLPPLSLTDDALAWLCQKDWADNLDGLQTLLVRAATSREPNKLSRAELAGPSERGEPTTVHYHHPQPGSRDTLMCDGQIRALKDIEADAIRLSLEVHGGRMASVARSLGISRSTLYRKLTELGLATQKEVRAAEVVGQR